MKNAKMSDVAKAAGVSLTTVGRALHGGYISEDKKERIEKAIKELGYIPNKAASELKSSSSHLIGHLMHFNPNQLYADIADGIERCAKEQGYSVFALTMYNPEDRSSMLEELLSRRVDGIIITSSTMIPRESVEKLTGLKIPVVMIERCFDVPGSDSIIINDIGGAESAVEKIAENGRKRIGFIGREPFGDTVEQERLDGYKKGLVYSGLPIDEKLILKTDGYGTKDGYAAAEKLLEEDIDGLFCCSDILAAGALQLLYDKKKRIPEDISVVGYDDTISKYLSPKISSVALNTELIGRHAVEMLISRSEDFERDDIRERIDTVFVDRKS